MRSGFFCIKIRVCTYHYIQKKKPLKMYWLFQRDLIDFKINQNIDELSWCVEKVKKLKLENKNEVINIEYLKDFTIPTDSLHNIVKNLRKCKNPKEFKVPDTKTVTVKDLINAFCHPDVIINVKKNLYKKVE